MVMDHVSVKWSIETIGVVPPGTAGKRIWELLWDQVPPEAAQFSF